MRVVAKVFFSAIAWAVSFIVGILLLPFIITYFIFLRRKKRECEICRKTVTSVSSDGYCRKCESEIDDFFEGLDSTPEEAAGYQGNTPWQIFDVPYDDTDKPRLATNIYIDMKSGEIYVDTNKIGYIPIGHDGYAL